jgi:hypothetical protein
MVQLNILHPLQDTRQAKGLPIFTRLEPISIEGVAILLARDILVRRWSIRAPWVGFLLEEAGVTHILLAGVPESPTWSGKVMIVDGGVT